MKAVQDALIERQSAWEDAYKLASNDPQIDLSGNGPVYDEYALENVSLFNHKWDASNGTSPIHILWTT